MFEDEKKCGNEKIGDEPLLGLTYYVTLMNELSASTKRLKHARSSLMRDVENVILLLDQQDRMLNERVLMAI